MRAGTAAAVILLLAALLRFWALDFGLPHTLTRPDETPVLVHTALPARGEFNVDWSIYPDAYIYLCWAWGELGLATARALGELPAGADYPATLRDDPAQLLLALRTLSAVASLAAVALLMAIARRELGVATALGAGALLATSFLHTRDAHFAKPDALLSLAVVAALAAMLPLARRATPARAALAGLGVGAATAVKYPGLLMLAPAWAAAVVGSSASGWRRLLPISLPIAAAVAVAVVVVTSPYLLLDPERLSFVSRFAAFLFPHLIPTPEGSEPAFPLEKLHGPGPSPYGAEGVFGTWVYHARFSLWFGAGAMATLLTPFAVAWGLACRQRLPLLCSVFALAYLVVVGASPIWHARYMTPLLPPLLLLEAGMLQAAARRWAGARAAPAYALAVLLVAAGPLASSLASDRVLSRTDTRVQATRWMERELPTGARIALYGTRFFHWGAPRLPAAATRVTAEPAPAAFDAAHVGYLVTHDHELYWSSVEPEILARLEPRLELLAAFEPMEAWARPVFESADAWYSPFHGFAGVQRPGPFVRIYRWLPDVDDTAAETGSRPGRNISSSM